MSNSLSMRHQKSTGIKREILYPFIVIPCGAPSQRSRRPPQGPSRRARGRDERPVGLPRDLFLVDLGVFPVGQGDVPEVPSKGGSILITVALAMEPCRVTEYIGAHSCHCALCIERNGPKQRDARSIRKRASRRPRVQVRQPEAETPHADIISWPEG